MARGDSIQSPVNQQALRDLARMRESLERLTGERGDQGLSAVRRVELQALASIELRSSQVTAAPTQAEHNALQTDVKTIFEALKRVSNLLGTAAIRKS